MWFRGEAEWGAQASRHPLRGGKVPVLPIFQHKNISLISHTTISWRKTQNHAGLPAQSPAPLPLHPSLHSDNVPANGTSFPEASRKLGLGGDGGERCLLAFLSTTQSSDSEGERFQTSKSKYSQQERGFVTPPGLLAHGGGGRGGDPWAGPAG